MSFVIQFNQNIAEMSSPKKQDAPVKLEENKKVEAVITNPFYYYVAANTLPSSNLKTDPLKQKHSDSQNNSRSRSRDKKNSMKMSSDSNTKNLIKKEQYYKKEQNQKKQKDRDYDDKQSEDLQKQEAYYKTKLCPLFDKVLIEINENQCKKGSTCNYAHGQKQLRGLPNFKKTRLCIAFKNSECFKSSQECKYAHGETELRKIQHYPINKDYDELPQPTHSRFRNYERDHRYSRRDDRSYQDSRDQKSHRDQPRDYRETRDYRDHRDQRDSRDNRSHREHRNYRDQRDQRDQRDHRDHRDYRDHKDHRDQRDHRDHRDQRDQREHREYRDERSEREYRERDKGSRDGNKERDMDKDYRYGHESSRNEIYGQPSGYGYVPANYNSAYMIPHMVPQTEIYPPLPSSNFSSQALNIPGTSYPPSSLLPPPSLYGIAPYQQSAYNYLPQYPPFNSSNSSVC